MEFSGPWNGPLSGFTPGAVYILGMICWSAIAHSSPIPPTVRVLVERERSSLSIEGFDILVKNAVTNEVVARGPGRSRLPFSCSLNGKIQLTAAKKTQMGPLRIESQGGFLRVNHRQYRDDLYLYSLNGDCMVVNHLDIEKYVAGLLNSEMSSAWNLETLKAQAVAARTYAIFQMREASDLNANKRAMPFDLDSSVKDQVYEGAHQERYKAIRAVSETQGQVLSFAGRPIKAFYHSTCGGHTETPEKVWGVRLPYLKAVKCGFCERSPRFKWNFTLTLKEVAQKLSARKLISGVLKGIRVANRNSMGRASDVEALEELSQTAGLPRTLAAATVSDHSRADSVGPMPLTQPLERVRRLTAAQLRDTLGVSLVRSTDFHVAQAGDWLAFAGHGSGHGVGLCQWGAKTMGEKGYAYKEILKKYYPLAEITKIY